jgi:hypothetical protein
MSKEVAVREEENVGAGVVGCGVAVGFSRFCLFDAGKRYSAT